MKKYFVYLHTNLINGKMYVGVTTAKNPECRWYGGKSYRGNPSFAEDIDCFGWDSFSHEYWEVDSEEAMRQCERDLISFFGTMIPNGYNRTKGGDWGHNYNSDYSFLSLKSERRNPTVFDLLEQRLTELYDKDDTVKHMSMTQIYDTLSSML